VIPDEYLYFGYQRCRRVVSRRGFFAFGPDVADLLTVKPPPNCVIPNEGFPVAPLVIERDEVVTSGKRVYCITVRTLSTRFWRFPLIKVNCWPIAGAEARTSPSASPAASACRMQTPIGWAADFAFGGRSLGPTPSPPLFRRLSGTPSALLRIVLLFYTKPCFPRNKPFHNILSFLSF
jgi:hypothetical protein